MWFKNLYIYRFTKPFDTTSDALEEQLSTAAFTPCGANDVYQLGWSSPLGKLSESLVHVADKYWMLCLTKQEKILPSSVVNEQVNERAELIEETQHRKVSRKEKTELKEQVTIELMPKAFARTNKYYAYLCPSKGYMVINTASAKTADEVTSYLRKTIGSLPVRPIEVKQSPATVMTQWLNRDTNPPGYFEPGLECELCTSGDEKGVVKYKGIDLDIEQIEQHIQSGMQVDKLALTWRENISFLLSTDLTVKRMKFSDLVQEKFDDTNAEDAAAKFDASFAIMAAEVDNLIPELIEAFGGEERSAIVEE
jgi:recombination associated protein RdgC